VLVLVLVLDPNNFFASAESARDRFMYCSTSTAWPVEVVQ
jgi:hypothetical protein